MAENIKKIIFTTKEAYETKKEAGTLDADAIYTVEASQIITEKDVKKTVDSDFDKFGLKLGLNEKAVEFYNPEISLASLLKELLKTQFETNYNNENYTRVGNGTKKFRTELIAGAGKTIINVIQNGIDCGYTNFEAKSIDNSGTLNIIDIPENVDITQPFRLKLSNYFDTNHVIIEVLPKYESLAIRDLNELVSKINFDQQVGDVVGSGNGNIIDGILYSADDADKFSFYELNPYSASYYGILPLDCDVSKLPDKVLLASDISGKYRLITDLGFKKYVDFGRGIWVEFPESVKETTIKLANRYGVIKQKKEAETKFKNRVTALVNSINFTTNKVDITGSDLSRDNAFFERVADAELINYTYYDTSNLIPILDKAATIKPLKVKAIFCQSGSIDYITALYKYPTLKLVRSGYNLNISDINTLPTSDVITIHGYNNNYSGGYAYYTVGSEDGFKFNISLDFDKEIPTN